MTDREGRFEELTREHAAVMASAIRRVCGRRFRALVPDVEQEVRLALWRRLEKGGEIRYAGSYLYKMALTTALRVVRGLETESGSSEDAERLADEPADERSRLARAERVVLMREVLAQLDPEHRRALESWLAGYNHVEVARLHGWTESVARHRIYRGIERLRARVGESRLDEEAELAQP